jgi:hypothetical protein
VNRAPIIRLERADAQPGGLEDRGRSLEGFRGVHLGHSGVMGENFPEGTSQSDPSAVPRTEQTSPDEEPPRRKDEGQDMGAVGRDDPSDETDAEETPESQQAG